VYTSEHGGHDLSRLEDEISLLEILNILLKRSALIIGVVVLTTGLSALVAQRKPTTYTSSTTFLAESSGESGGGALSLARQVGVVIGSQNGQRTPQFYVDLITSREVLWQAVTKSYVRSHGDEDSDETDLVTYYEIEGQTEAERIQRAVERLTRDISVSADRETGVVRLSVTTSDPQLSQEVAQHILDLVHRFDLTTRQTQAGAERRFSGERLADLRRELGEAEDTLRSFLNENRVFRNSPTLQFEHDRLQRAVAMRQELVTSLAQAYESARIEEVRNTPVITLIDPPRVPALRDPMGRRLILGMGILLGVIGGTIAAFVLNSFDQARRMGSADFQHLSDTWNQISTDVGVLARRPFGRSAR
jgi:uncharacterized protein involved in exopolysaccharide biosynthesis